MTFTFKDLCGITITAEPLRGADLEELTSAQANKPIGDRILTILARRVKAIGTNKSISEELLSKKVPLQNLQYWMFMLRNLSYGEPETFDFTFPYKSLAEETKGEELTMDYQEPLKDRQHKKYAAQVEELVDFPMTYEVEIGGELYQWAEPTHHSSKFINRLKRHQINNINIAFVPRQVKRKYKKEDGTEHWLIVNQSDLFLPVISKLMKDFESKMAYCDTRIEFEHPESDLVEPSDSLIILNMLEMSDFFLDSASQ